MEGPPSVPLIRGCLSAHTSPPSSCPCCVFVVSHVLVLYTKHTARARAEAAALAAALHPGVVELVDATDTTVRTRLVDGRALAEAGPLAPEEVAGLAAAVATTLADLHERGIVHGAIDASHVLITGEGRPVLCSLGRGGEPGDDVAALGRLVTSLLAGGEGQTHARVAGPVRRPRLGPMLAPPAAPALHILAADATAADPARRPGARALATAIHEQVPAARLPNPGTGPLLPPGAMGRPGRPLPPLARRVVVASAPLLLVVALGWLALRDPESPRPGERPALPAQASRPPVAAPPAPAHFHEGVLTFEGARYAVGRPGDAVALGDWSCTGRPTPVVVRPATGEVFAFDGWPEPGRDVTARSLGRVERAWGARANRAGANGCDDVEVLRSEGPPVRLKVSP